jgi:hypothetical protein
MQVQEFDTSPVICKNRKMQVERLSELRLFTTGALE